MTIRMYADFKKSPLENVAVRLNHEKKTHTNHCVDCDTKVARVDHIDRSITLEGPLDVDQRKRLMEIADKCQIKHRHKHCRTVGLIFAGIGDAVVAAAGAGSSL